MQKVVGKVDLLLMRNFEQSREEMLRTRVKSLSLENLNERERQRVGIFVFQRGGTREEEW